MNSADQEIYIKFDNVYSSIKSVYDYYCTGEYNEFTEDILKRAGYLVDHVSHIKNMLYGFSNKGPSCDEYNLMLSYLGDISKGLDSLPSIPADFEDKLFNNLNEFICIFISRFDQ